MKITCLKKHLKDSISLAEKITNKNLHLPILGSVLISAKNNKPGKIKLTATNLEIGIEINIPAKIEEEGEVAVPAGIINGFLSNFNKADNINLELVNNNLVISAPNTSTLIKSYPIDDFPSLPTIKEENVFSLPVKEFISGLKSVYYGASLSGIKPEISSVYINSSDKTPLVFVATDSFRLAEKKIPYKFKGFSPLIIPYRSIVEIIRIFENKEGDIDIIFDKNQIILIVDNIKFISRLIDGIFPDYKQIIPQKFTTTAVVNKEDLMNILKTASIFSGRLNEVNLIIHKSDNMIEIKTSSQETGEYNTTINSDIIGEDIKISFNYRYIVDCLNYINTDTIVMNFNGPNKPLVITNKNTSDFQYLVMPMNA
ncbi:MAG: DNA polymerase III subunit beta [Parcubacteria group bacterium]|nr:DNA polymerase III subunit beta [Parcubacteria group bacterium]MCR4342801.1 DNA polymerase III subunit beta [Patescibacteria group bacterium]